MYAVFSEVFPSAPSRSALGGALGTFPPRGVPGGSIGGPLEPPSAGSEMGEALQELLQDMNVKFASLSSSILGKLDDMSQKLDALERQLTGLLAEEEGNTS